ncbi:MAG: DUF255 domain-containing protein [Phycisphaeraceae bacterium]|nr:DUF255 domain-containing protein [Phycisphaeraceae bacterium]
MKIILTALVLAVVTLASAPALAQNPIQWYGNARSAISFAKEQDKPLMFWIYERRDIGEEDDLYVAQEASFRDPAVVQLAQTFFVPVQVARNNRVIEELEKFGLPTSHGLFLALVTPDGKLLDEIGPGEVANAPGLAKRLADASRKYLDDLYATTLQPIITSPESSKSDVREAVQKVWRLGIQSADKDIVALLDRADLTPGERSRLDTMLASIATPTCITALVDRAAAGDKDARRALFRAEPGALETLLADLPPTDGDATARQIVAYEAAADIANLSSPRPESFWKSATPEDKAREIEALKRRAEPVLEHWKQRAGLWR